MVQTIYIEKKIAAHPRVQAICQRLRPRRQVLCDRYTEVFNRKAQNFRLQKRQPALILAEKFDHFVLPTPATYGIGGKHNYYFSHMLNCLYDCRYCFLQGMYRSAHYVLFINYEDFQRELSSTLERHQGEPVTFFSGYDCDSLALDPVTGFSDVFLPWFRQRQQAHLELRTKSTQIRSLMAMAPIANCVIAFSFTPAEISQALEHKVPSITRRVDAMVRLQTQGWQIGLRFDPLIWQHDFRDQYRRLFATIFKRLRGGQLHSVSIGEFRLPTTFFENVYRLYPDEQLFAGTLEQTSGMVSYPQQQRRELLQFCTEELRQYVAPELVYRCQSS